MTDRFLNRSLKYYYSAQLKKKFFFKEIKEKYTSDIGHVAIIPCPFLVYPLHPSVQPASQQTCMTCHLGAKQESLYSHWSVQFNT